MKIRIVKPLKDQLTNIFHLLNYVTPDPKNALTDLEIEVLASLCLLPDKFEHSRFSTIGRKKALEILSTEFQKQLVPTNFNNKVYSILKKGFLVRDEDNIIYFKEFVQKILDSIKANQRFEVNIEYNVEGS